MTLVLVGRHSRATAALGRVKAKSLIWLAVVVISGMRFLWIVT